MITVFVDDATEARDARRLKDSAWAQLILYCSSLLINLGETKHNSDIITQGERLVRIGLGESSARDLHPELHYNLGNALTAQHDLEIRQYQDVSDAEGVRYVLMKNRATLRDIRFHFAFAAREGLSGDARGRALCNLANSLDESGRWLEAYQAYMDALEHDPTNGNAAGNVAQAIWYRVLRRRGQSGHYAALYEHYRQLAVSLRQRTVEVAGEAVARRWDALPVVESEGHLDHVGDTDNAYAQWVRNHRVALTVALEGLGSDAERWDDALPEGVSMKDGSAEVPAIYRSLNVLKAEYLVSRRLAYEGELALMEGRYLQANSDTGVYVDTMDMSVYGEPSAQLILAQRSTLDTLDKIAVAANDHFGTALKADSVAFHRFWLESDQSTLRAGLPTDDMGPGAVIALAELAYDMNPEGLYPEAKTLRHAGTHRLVNVTHGQATGATKGAHSTVDADALVAATQESLRVARAAFMYLIDLVHDGEQGGLDETDTLHIPVPTQI
ncbi:LA2681 family HEPN domain-containing protein [Clavibacter michiganensis]|uniref:LA2681 family HEPN domain-containing protein n=1 Tax=Clavibacter michiganensis TaxID=28447 RepID=UPI003DA0D693